MLWDTGKRTSQTRGEKAQQRSKWSWTHSLRRVHPTKFLGCNSWTLPFPLPAGAPGPAGLQSARSRAGPASQDSGFCPWQSQDRGEHGLHTLLTPRTLAHIPRGHCHSDSACWGHCPPGPQAQDCSQPGCWAPVPGTPRIATRSSEAPSPREAAHPPAQAALPSANGGTLTGQQCRLKPCKCNSYISFYLWM